MRTFPCSVLRIDIDTKNEMVEKYKAQAITSSKYVTYLRYLICVVLVNIIFLCLLSENGVLLMSLPFRLQHFSVCLWLGLPIWSRLKHHIHDPQRMKPVHPGDPLTFCLAPP